MTLFAARCAPVHEPAMRDTMKFIDKTGLEARGIQLSISQLRRNMQAGKFPKQVKISEHRLAWVESEIDAWQAERMKEREQTAA
jgi:prophage regulatory protein